MAHGMPALRPLLATFLAARAIMPPIITSVPSPMASASFVLAVVNRSIVTCWSVSGWLVM